MRRGVILVLWAVACSSTETGVRREEAKFKAYARYSQAELRERLEAFASSFMARTVNTADEMARSSSDYVIQRNSLTWKTSAFGSCRSALNMADPRIGLLDIWVLSIQFADFVASDAGADALGEHQDEVERASRHLAKLADDLARDYWLPDSYAAVKVAAQQFAKDNPFVELTRQPFRPSLAGGKAKGFSLLGDATGLSSTAASIQDISTEIDQMQWLLEWTPRVWRWELQILLLDHEQSDLIQQLAGNAQTTTDTMVRLQEQIDLLPQELRQQVELAIDHIDTKHTDLRETMGQVRTTIETARDTLKESREIVDKVDGMLGKQSEFLKSLDESAKSLTVLSDTLNPTVKEIRGLIADVAPDEDAEPVPPEKDYTVVEMFDSMTRTGAELTKASTEIGKAVRDLREVLQSDDVERQLGGVESTANAAVDHIAWRAVQVIGAALVAFLVGAIAYVRFIRPRARD